MVYTPLGWNDNDASMPVSAARLTYLEQGIEDAHDLAVAGSLIDAALRFTPFNVQAIGTTLTDVDGMSLVVPPQDRSYQLSLFVLVNFVTGTAAAAAVTQVNLTIADYTSTVKTVRASSADMIQVTTTSKIRNQSLEFSTDPLPPNNVTRYYKLQTRLLSAIPANWSTTQLFADDPNDGVGVWGSMKMQAVSL